MNKKINGILLGIFFVTAGILFLLREQLPFRYGYLIMMIAGIELLTAHIYNKSLPAVILGTYLTYSGLLHLVQLDYFMYRAMIASAVFFVPAIIFFILYIRQRKRGQLTWLCLFLLLGVDTVINSLTGIDVIGSMLICVGIALVLDYLLGATYAYTSRLQFGIFLIVIGVIKMTDWREYINYIFPAMLIMIGIFFIAKTLRKK